jgi:CHAT domain-containing protein/tetratricopeptide (TPR) repeat protein
LRRAARLLPLLLAVLFFCGAETAPPAAPLLHDGFTQEREIRGGETHAYAVELQAGQFLRVTVQEKGVDVEVRLFDPEGVPVVAADSLAIPLFPHVETEDLTAVAGRAGVHRLEVVASGKQEKGHYLLRVEGLKTPEPADRTRAEAVMATWRGLVKPVSDEDEQSHSLERAAALWEEVGEHRKAAQIFFHLGGKRQKLGRYAEAANDFQRSVALWTNEKSPQSRDWEARALSGEGLSLRHMKRLTEARTCYEKALVLEREVGDEGMEGAVLGNLGGLASDQGEVRRAIDLELEGLELVRKAHDEATETRALGNLANDYQLIAENQKAVHYYEEALALARRLHNRGEEGLVLNNLADLYSELGDYDKALSHWQEALKLAGTASDRKAKTLNNLGTACMRLGRYAEARRYFKQALALGEKDVETAVFSLDNQAFLALRRNEPAQALELAQKALPLSKGFGEPEAYSHYALGSAYRDLEKWPEAKQELAAAREIYHQRGQVLREADIALAMARVERGSGHLEEALAQVRSALALVEPARSRVVRQDLRTSFSAARQDFYELLIDTLMARGLAAEALQASERARARILLEVLHESETDVRQGADPALVERERRLRDEVNRDESRRIELTRQEKPDPARLGAVRKKIDDTLEELQQVEASLRESSPRYAALTEPQPLTAAEVQAQVLDGRALLLEYALGAKESFLWLVGSGGIETFTLPGRKQIESVALRYYKHLTARNGQQPGETVPAWKARIAAADRQAGQEGLQLSRMILARVEKRLGDRPLLVVTEGALQYVPFSALPLPSSGAPLVSRHEVVSLPSATALAALRRELRERKPAPRELAIFADPVFQTNDPRLKPPLGPLGKLAPPAGLDEPAGRGAPEPEAGRESGIDVSKLRRLPSSQREAETIAALMPSDQVFKALGFAASKSAVVGGRLDAYRKLHFATHGVLDTGRPELSGLVLSLYDEHGGAQDGVLRLNDIYNLHLDADLVVLSACRTALGKEVRGEGLIGLTRGFMYAGAARVLATLWSVEDQATAELMANFYRGILREGLSPAAALRKAQLAMRRDPKRQSPYYWAGFSLQGEWR